MKKIRIILLGMFCIFLMTGNAFAFSIREINPMWTDTSRSFVRLSITSGTAKCSGVIKGSTGTSKVTGIIK